MHDEIVVAVNGANFSGWKTATVTRSIDTVCGSFEVGLMDKWQQDQQPIEIKPGDPCQVFAGGEPVITGYIDTVSPSISTDNHEVRISGRDKTCDLVDCSTEIDSFEVHGLGLAGLAYMVCEPFGIDTRIETDVGDPFEWFDIQIGETAFNCLDRAARMRGVLLTTDGQGALVLSAKGKFTSSGDALVYGQNVKSAVGNYDFRDRYSDYKAHGQMPALGWGGQDPHNDLLGKARDENVMRYRPLLITAENWADPEGVTTRAKNEATARAGKSSRVNVQVVGWRQSSGSLWEPGLKVAVTIPPLYLPNVVFVISTVRYSFSDSSGTITELELCRPDAYLDAGSGEVEKDPFDE